MKTKISIKLIILLPIFGLLLVGVFVFGLFILYKIIQEPNFIGLIAVSMFLWMSIGFSYMLFDKIMSFEINNGILTTRKIFTRKEVKTELSKIKYKEYDWGEMYWTKMKGIIIKTDNDKTETLSVSAYRNSTEFIDLIIKSCMRDENLKPNLGYKDARVFLSIGGIILLALAIYKWIN
ncbi:MAG: hypothetical protein Q8O88_00135 [bacterium]|nr:hypothetical protein [bacterium]